MAAMEGGDDAEGTLFAVHPLAWIIVPMAFFIAFMVALMLVKYRRRRRRAMREKYGSATTTPPSNQNGPMYHNRDAPFASTTPTWSERARNIAGLKRRDDGLNEFGEAPPAYTAPVSNKTARASTSTSSSSQSQMRSYGAPMSTAPPPMGSVSIPMPGGPPTYHPMTAGNYLRPQLSPTAPMSQRPNANLSKPQPAALR